MRWHPRKKANLCKPRKVYGLHVVREYLHARPWDIQEIYLLPALKEASVAQLARRGTIPIRYETPAFFDQLAQGKSHQGVGASLHPFPYVSLENILRKEADIILLLDGVLDPRNLGALLRTAEAVGVGGVILPRRRAAALSAVVEKAATGATAHLPICRVENLVRVFEVIRQAGYWLVGLAPGAQETLYGLSIPDKVALVVGGEEKGLRCLTRRACDYVVSIPMRGKVESLNVSVAGAIALYEVLRKKTLR